MCDRRDTCFISYAKCTVSCSAVVHPHVYFTPNAVLDSILPNAL